MPATFTRTLLGYAAFALLVIFATLSVPVRAGAGVTIISLI